MNIRILNTFLKSCGFECVKNKIPFILKEKYLTRVKLS